MKQRVWPLLLALCLALTLLPAAALAAPGPEGPAEIPAGTALRITAQPTSVTVAEGAKAGFSVQAAGEDLTYQWYYKDSIHTAFRKSTCRADTFLFTAHSVTNGRQLYCVVGDAAGNSVKSYTVTLHLRQPITIETQPRSAAVLKGKQAYFWVSALGDELTYQWYYRDPGADAFRQSTCTKPTFSFAAHPATDGRQLYCVIRDGYGNSVRSALATLTVTRPAVRITSQPQSAQAGRGSQVRFSVGAEGEGLRYQWFYKDAKAAEFRKSTCTASAFSFTALAATDGRQLYCEVTDRYGNTARSTLATLTLWREVISFTVQPQSVTADRGERAVFTAQAVGRSTTVTYRWYTKDPGGEFMRSSVTGPEYAFTAYPAADGRQIYCLAQDSYGNTAQSRIVTFTLRKEPVRITAQPVSAVADKGEKISFETAAAGDGLTWQWYYRDRKDDAFRKSTCRAARFTFTALAATDGRQLYCEVTDSAGNTAKTDTVTLTLARPALAVTAWPADRTAERNASVTFSVRATGDGLTYRWYYRDRKMDEFKQSVCRTPDFTFTAVPASNGRQIYCEVSDSAGNTQRSGTVTLSLT